MGKPEARSPETRSPMYRRRASGEIRNLASVSSSLLPAFGSVMGEGSAQLRRFVIAPYDRRYRVWQVFLVILVVYFILARVSQYIVDGISLHKNIQLLFLSKLGPPEMAGELGVIFNIPQPFTVRSKRLSQVIRISHHHFKQLLQPLTDDGKKILSNFFQHLKGLQKEELEEIPMVRELLGDPNTNEIIVEPEGPESNEGQNQQENRTFPIGVIIHRHHPHDELKEEHRGKLVHLPDSIQELLSIAEKRFGKKGTKVLMANGSEVEDICALRENDCLYIC